MNSLCFVRYKQTPFGGAENYLSRLVLELQKRGIEYLTISTNGYGENSIKIYIPKWLPSFLKPIIFNLRVCAYLKSVNFFCFSLERLVCAHIYRAGDGVHKEWLTLRLGNETFLKKIAILSNPLHPLYLFLEKKTFQNAKKIVANSQRVKSEIIHHYGIDEAKIEVIYNGVNISSFDKASAKRGILNELKIDENKKIVLFVGSGFYRKGVSHYLKVVSLLKSDVLGIIIGKEKRIGKYKKEAKNLGIGEKVLFLGARSDAERFYAAGDIFLFPTMYEPFSNASLEALGYGNILVTTEQNGVAEIAPHKELVMKSPSDYEAAKKIDEILDNEDMLLSMQKESTRCAKNYTVEKNVALTLEVISGVGLFTNP